MTPDSQESSDLNALRRNYRAALLRYLPRREEDPLHVGYELGRRAVEQRLSMLELVRLHHDVLLEILQTTRSEDLPQVAMAASEFLLEALATYDMTQRSSLEGR
jgi:Phosphoserine phosphatase RsbU, N-terminal domain